MVIETNPQYEFSTFPRTSIDGARARPYIRSSWNCRESVVRGHVDGRGEQLTRLRVVQLVVQLRYKPIGFWLRVRHVVSAWQQRAVLEQLSEHLLDDIGVERGTFGRSRVDVQRMIRKL